MPRPEVSRVVPTPVRLLQTAARLGARPAYATRRAEGWVTTSWAVYAEEIRRAARALRAAGIGRGDTVAILSFNRAEWAISAWAALLCGAVPVGIYWTSSTDDIAYILADARARLLVCEDDARFAKVLPRLATLPHVERVVMLEGAATAHPTQQTWAAFTASGDLGDRTAIDAEVDRLTAAISPDDLGSLIYTSGTTGPAKAVALSHQNLAWTAAALVRAFEADETDRLISYLPFAHVAEQVGCIHNHAVAGFTVYYARTMEELGDHLKEVHPTVFFGVPRVWEKMQTAIEARLGAATGPRAVLARWAIAISRRWHAAILGGQRPGAWLEAQHRLAERLVLRRVRTAMGLDRARMLISGAAPIAVANLEFFTGLGLVIRELYGQSEASGPTTLSTPGHTRFGAVGKPLAGIEVEIAADDEIRVRGPGVFVGYAGRPDDTAATMDDGWLLTGDLGRLDADGFLYITGRKKDLLITSGGKNISPGNLETALMAIPLVEHAVVCGDGRHFLAALVTLDPAVLAELARAHGWPSADRAVLAHDPEIRRLLDAAIAEVNEQQARVAQIRKFTILERGLSIEAGELTPTLKVKRQAVLARERAVVAALYDEPA